jgi:hypothetical protein
MRDKEQLFRVWADALCINQQDDEEKNQQVGMMGRTYALAHHTTIHF